jgi:hypothetical protein
MAKKNACRMTAPDQPADHGPDTTTAPSLIVTQPRHDPMPPAPLAP